MVESVARKILRNMIFDVAVLYKLWKDGKAAMFCCKFYEVSFDELSHCLSGL